MAKVFIVWHTFEYSDGSGESEKMVGIYESLSDAEAALERAKLLPGFRDSLSGFSIDSYEVGRDQWPEGFVEIRDE